MSKRWCVYTAASDNELERILNSWEQMGLTIFSVHGLTVVAFVLEER